jgi:hypothetical protein
MSVAEADKALVAPKPARTATRFAEISGPGQRVPLATPREPIPISEALPTAYTGPAEPRPVLTAPPEPPLLAAIRAHLEHRPADAAELLRGYDPGNREILTRLLPALVHAKAADLNQPADAAVLAAQLGSAAEAAARTAPLAVRKACFVSDVKQYGVYSPLPVDYVFLPGGKAMLYAEIGNVVSDPSPHPAGGDGFATRVHCTLQLLDHAGHPVALTDPKHGRPAGVIEMPNTDFTRSPIRDYFLVFEFQVPNEPGPFTATFDVKDPKSGRGVRRSVPFRVGGG